MQQQYQHPPFQHEGHKWNEPPPLSSDQMNQMHSEMRNDSLIMFVANHPNLFSVVLSKFLGMFQRWSPRMGYDSGDSELKVLIAIFLQNEFTTHNLPVPPNIRVPSWEDLLKKLSGMVDAGRPTTNPQTGYPMTVMEMMGGELDPRQLIQEIQLSSELAQEIMDHNIHVAMKYKNAQYNGDTMATSTAFNTASGVHYENPQQPGKWGNQYHADDVFRESNTHYPNQTPNKVSNPMTQPGGALGMMLGAGMSYYQQSQQSQQPQPQQQQYPPQQQYRQY